MPRAILIPFELFDSDRYIINNSDVIEAVASGKFASPYDHYFQFGFKEEAEGLRVQSFPSESAGIIFRNAVYPEPHQRILDLEIENRALRGAWDANLHRINKIDFDMISEVVPDEVTPYLDRREIDEASLDPDQKAWRNNGYLILKDFLPHDLIESYANLRQKVPHPGGWSCPTPYMHIREIRDLSLYAPLLAKMKALIGEEMGLHLNLTGWVSTERNWHQDDYLNPPYINSWYAAVWMALDDIHPDCGPFEFVPGSHRWPLLRSHKVKLYLTPEERDRVDWPKTAERFVDEIIEEEILRRGVKSDKFIAKKGDVLIWHGRLIHRGSIPNVPGMMRKALISHYSGISHRLDMQHKAVHASGGTYFVHGHALDYDPYDDALEAVDLPQPAFNQEPVKASAVRTRSGRGVKYLKRLLARLSA